MNNIFKHSYTHYIVYETICLVNNKTYIGSHATDNINDGNEVYYLFPTDPITAELNKGRLKKL